MPDTDQLAIVRSLATEERYTMSPREKIALRAVLARLDALIISKLRLDALDSTCRAVLHQLVHGEAGEGDERDIRWCIRTLSEAVGKREGSTNA